MEVGLPGRGGRFVPMELPGENHVFSPARSRVGRRVPSPPEAGT